MSAAKARAVGDRDALFGLLITLLALVPRLYVAIAWAREPVWDGHYYDFGARRIAAGLGYSDDLIVGGVARWHPWCHYPVGYSGFLAGLYKVFGDGPYVATIANAAVGALLVLLTHQIAIAMLPRARARIAAGLCAIHPALVLYSALVMTEVLSAFLPALALWLALRDRDRVPWRGAVLAGIVMAVATLVSPQAIVLAPALGIVLVPHLQTARHWLCALSRGAAVTAVALAFVAPWTLRNCRVMDGCAFVSTNGGWNLAIGSFRRATGRFETLRASDGCDVVTGQVQQDRCWAQRGWQSIRSEPGRWLGLAPRKLDHCFNHDSFAVEYLRTADPAAWPEPRRTLWRGALSTFHRVLMAAAAFGLLGFVRRPLKKDLRALAIEGALWIVTAALVVYAVHDDKFPFWALALWMPLLLLVPRPLAPRYGAAGWFIGYTLLSFDLVHIVFFGEDRYHIPLVPFLCILAAGLLRSTPRRLQPDPAAG